jgi:5,5'-dehydrodivanillate O-demethylase
MLTADENQALTRVGPGTPAGELLRRYWLPFMAAQELTHERPTKFIRLLGEDLVAFHDRSGRVGLLSEHCPHRGCSLLYGRPEARGIACAYHGWLFDTGGNCLETPAEPAGSQFHRTVTHTAYPVQKFVGLYWAYLGPEPAPVIPRYDVWVRTDGRRRIVVHPRLDCNWFQAMENSADPVHADVLHHEFHAQRGVPITNSTRGNVDEIQQYDFRLIPIGLMKIRVTRTTPGSEHPLIFPNILRVGNNTQIRVPIDDTHTMIFRIAFEPTPDGSVVDDGGDPPVAYLSPWKHPPDAIHPLTRYDMMAEVQAQDHMAWETQGPIADRTVERLATSDRGIVMLRELTLREIAKAQRGEDPMGVERDPNHAMIDTNLEAEYVARVRARASRR